jgi:hypothetical protein
MKYLGKLVGVNRATDQRLIVEMSCVAEDQASYCDLVLRYFDFR